MSVIECMMNIHSEIIQSEYYAIFNIWFLRCLGGLKNLLRRGMVVCVGNMNV